MIARLNRRQAMPNPSVRLLLSCASNEFGAYRDALRRVLTRPNVEVKIQEDFKALGGDTLTMLAEYVEQCEVVVHFVGEMAGSTPAANSVDDLLTRHPELETRLAKKDLGRDALKTLTYTQWEAWLAIGFERNLLIVEPAKRVRRGKDFAPTDASRAVQEEHLKRLKAIDRYPGPPFKNEDNLVAQILGTAVIDALVKAAAKSKWQPRNLPLASLGDLFKGREKALVELRAALVSAKGGGVLVRALHGLGGVGKTRLAIEYAWAHEADHSALLFVHAESAAGLKANLAALAGSSVLDPPEKEVREDEAKIEAVLRWLGANPTWLMILDNVDDPEAVKAVTELMPRLKGGHAIVTARAANFPATIRKLELDVLAEEAATQFLLERTANDRQRAKDDKALARTLGRELGGLALGLEQAGAQIATDRIGFARYLKLWNDNREATLAWSDAILTGSERTLATTWTTSVARLSPESRRFLDRLAMFAPDPIPDSLLDAPIPGERADYDAQKARAELFAYSLIARAKGEDGQAFVIHRLVQDFARRAMSEQRRAEALREALGWVNKALAGEPSDVRTWPVINPLAPHALAVAQKADAACIAEPTGRVLIYLGGLSRAKARYAEAEPLLRRALVVNEKSLGPDHPTLASRLNNLANLLHDTNRLAEAERLYRRALKIEESQGPDHPTLATRLNNLATLLNDTNRLTEAESLYRRALAIWEVCYGPDHPSVAIGLNNVAQVLDGNNRCVEAEPLFRRALKIDEASYGPDHPAVASRLNNLAALLHRTDRVAEAERLYRRALAIYEASYGPDHPTVAKNLNNLAGLLQVTNRLAEAEQLYRRALAISEASLGPDHHEVAVRLNNLALLLQATNRLAEAEPLYRRALAISEGAFGPDHPSTEIVRENLTAIEAARGKKA
jgi:tetratricopeptide (TPR) repeat protein